MISEDDLLTEIRRLADGKTAPTYREMDRDGEFSSRTYNHRFGSWWQGVVRAGTIPHSRRPLTDQQFEQMVEAAQARQRPRWKLTALLHLFTGLPAGWLDTVTADSVTDYASGTLVTVPGSETNSGKDWEFRVPGTWGNGKNTELPGLLAWYLNRHGQIEISRWQAQHIVHRVARDANISRPTVESNVVGTVPDVTPGDLRATGGVRMARNGAPARRIRRHLGIEHTGWKATVEDFFLWNYVHHGVVHNQYDPPDVVLDP